MRLVSLLISSVLTLTCASPPSEDRPAAAEPIEPSWVSLYDPAAAWNGYTLVYRSRSFPMLIDMHGRVVHSWPEVRSKSRARLLPDCNVLVISRGRGVAEYDWRGNKVWRASFSDRFPHHDLIRLANGNTVVLTRRKGGEADDVVELDREGEIVWMWESAEPLREFIESKRRRHAGDATHMNSVQELPDNPWHRDGDRRFRPGNLLISARNLNLIFILDRSSGEVVWSYQGDLDLQHEALMLGEGSERSGRILLFDNRYSSFEGDRGSRVIELDPRDGSITWSYAAPGFFSATGGSQQPLPNGNVLIGSSNGRRAFEVDRSGRTVWEWTPPFPINRPSRYAWDYCPRLEDLGPADGPPIRPPAGYRHVDPESYRFSRSNDRAEVELAGVTRRVLRNEERCARVFLPTDASVRLGYGLDAEALEAAGLEDYRATFSLTLRNPANDTEVAIFEDVLDQEELGWRERTVDLAELSHRHAVVCARLDQTSEPDSGRFAYWGAPVIRSAGEGEEEGEEPDLQEWTAEELEVRQEHLRAMGYVN